MIRNPLLRALFAVGVMTVIALVMAAMAFAGAWLCRAFGLWVFVGIAAVWFGWMASSLYVAMGPGGGS